ncbi:uncharacterized protein LOC107263082 isoform X2 [Cephus cinctus]|uniref:Uncharacterized protein LOC107263082 isoform X2 n=1 Tax=Cephus cinctus TaxID=211228 RepID=A0AAJ7R8F8_CEPCN|nr:uncharacterized protein LOC107263082 isoform X2 [Cephus cinctus]
MRGILIFDHLNDVLFTKCNKKFTKHIQKLAKIQGLVVEGKMDGECDQKLSPNIIIQLFSPIVTSQNIMASQFGNSYTSVRCQDGTNMVFDDFMGYTFMYIAIEDVALMKRTLGVCVSIVRHLCGPDVTIKNAQDLSASDILLMVLMCWVANRRGKGTEIDTFKDNADDEDDDFLLPQSSPSGKEEERHSFTATTKLANPTSEDITKLFGDSRDSSVSEGLYSFAEDGLYSQLVLLGSERGYTANAIHISELSEGINLVTIVEVTNLATSSGLYDSFYHLNIINGLQLQRDIDELRPAFDNLDGALKKALDGIKKNRAHVSNDVDMCQRRLQVKWEFVRKKYMDLLKSRDPESILQIESNTSGFIETMKELFRLTCFDNNFLKQGTDVIVTVSRLVRQKLNDFSDFLKVKALKNFTLGSRTSLTINKYLEEFPGLVHFIYIDRTTHRLTTPTLDFTNPETLALTTKKIWAMVENSRSHLQEGHLAVMWKDTTFNYSYFLWFEDSSGSPLKSKAYLNHIMKTFPIPGILCGDYYRKLVEACFPKLSPNKIRVYELYCVHLGLATSSCVLEHSRRLAATIWEVTGLPNNPADIL